MGLLDDAIREHLELKRRRGADPEEVAREQREALDAAAERRAASAGAVADPAMAVPEQGQADSPEIDEDRTSIADDPNEDHALTAGETAELDMSSVLGEEGDAQDADHVPAQAGAEDPAHAGARPVPAQPPTEEESLEWEVPGEAAEVEAEEPPEDVLEETPEFLRDTPEQDRLWFEQRPPRDFDFDK
jgi:hypothetical protein